MITSLVFYDFVPNRAKAEAHNPERATPILGLCHGVFTDRFSFRHILYLRLYQSTFRLQLEKRKC